VCEAHDQALVGAQVEIAGDALTRAIEVGRECDRARGGVRRTAQHVVMRTQVERHEEIAFALAAPANVGEHVAFGVHRLQASDLESGLAAA
jgi:hypothetical protein